MSTLKPPGAACPSCGQQRPTEYAMSDKVQRWKCTCGAEGLLATPATAPAVPKGPVVHPHWSTKRAA